MFLTPFLTPQVPIDGFKNDEEKNIIVPKRNPLLF